MLLLLKGVGSLKDEPLSSRFFFLGVQLKIRIEKERMNAADFAST